MRKNEGGGAVKQERQSLPHQRLWQRRQPLPHQVTTGLAPMEGIERTNVVVVGGTGQGAGQNMGTLLDRTPMPWRWIMGEIVMPVEVSGTWSATVGIGAEGDQWKEGE